MLVAPALLPGKSSSAKETQQQQQQEVVEAEEQSTAGRFVGRSEGRAARCHVSTQATHQHTGTHNARAANKQWMQKNAVGA